MLDIPYVCLRFRDTTIYTPLRGAPRSLALTCISTFYFAILKRYNKIFTSLSIQSYFIILFKTLRGLFRDPRQKKNPTPTSTVCPWRPCPELPTVGPLQQNCFWVRHTFTLFISLCVLDYFHHIHCRRS